VQAIETAKIWYWIEKKQTLTRLVLLNKSNQTVVWLGKNRALIDNEVFWGSGLQPHIRQIMLEFD
jgi:hypothetical protein